MIAYRTSMAGPREGSLDLAGVKDRVYVLLDGRLQGVSGRSRSPAGALPLNVPAGKHALDLVVENMGRINYGPWVNDERKGGAAPVTFGEKELSGFSMVNLPLQAPWATKFEEIQDGKARGAGTLYRGVIHVGAPADTWLDMRGFGRGMVWLNGHNLGRYWKVGPVQSIFVPGCWLNAEKDNEVIVLELESENPPLQVATSKDAIWGN
ncbi:hypothetical protein [Luteolibacter sp. LG18]|uniref:hypothetical protein n=1 Tax=Luteolibacter sp. LG18 TaxID=2819286 RepID=UPI002B2D84F0|nr:hypothetical protein llg_31380 [Luteolibacter sp. LG18]